MDKQQADSSYLPENMTEVRRSERCSYEGSLEEDPQSQVGGREQDASCKATPHNYFEDWYNPSSRARLSQ